MKYLVLLFTLLVLVGCGPTKHPTDETKTKADCTPTDLYIYESNPVGWRRVYNCGDDK